MEGFNAAALFVDDHSGYRWLYGCKTKDEALGASKRWMAEIHGLLEKYSLLLDMRDNACENKSKEISFFFTSMEVANQYSTAYEQHQDCLSESGVKSIFLLARLAMTESGLAGKYWFCAATCGKDCRNATYMKRIKNTPWELLFGERRDVSKFRPFGCRAWMFLNKDRREKGKTAPGAVEVINLGLAQT